MTGDECHNEIARMVNESRGAGLHPEQARRAQHGLAEAVAVIERKQTSRVVFPSDELPRVRERLKDMPTVDELVDLAGRRDQLENRTAELDTRLDKVS